MKKSILQRIGVVMLAACFMAGTLGAAYHPCEMEMPTKQEMAIEGMDCHGSAPAEPAEEKNCCVDLTCPKCFGSPLTFARYGAVERQVAQGMELFIPAYRLSSHNPAAPERPPKIG